MPALSVLLLLIGFTLDVFTHSSLVVGIVFNIPLVLSALTLSRSFLLRMTVWTLLANLLAGWINGLTDGNTLTTLLNRVMVGVSLLLVGFLSLRMQDTSIKAARLKAEEERARRESKLRQILNQFTAGMLPQAFIEQTVRVLQEATAAKAVVALRVEDPTQVVAGVPMMPWTSAKIQVLLDRDSRWEVGWQDVRLVLDRPGQESLSWVREVLSDLTPLYQQALLRRDLELRQSQLQDRTEVIRDLMYAFSHDLRTPILANVMSMKLALSGVYGELSDNYREALHNGIQANQEVLSLAESLLQVAKLEIEGEQLEAQSLDLSGLIEHTTEGIRPLLDPKSLRLEMHLLNPVMVQGNAAELRRVLLNLLDNAIKWSPEQGKLEVQMERKGQVVLVSILDDGPGIPEGQERHVFHRFRKTGAGAGSGLGLYLSFKILQAHHGRLTYNRTPDHRTEFRFVLPVEEK